MFTYANCEGATSYNVEINGLVGLSGELTETSGTIAAGGLVETSEVKITITNADSEEIISITKTITFI